MSQGVLHSVTDVRTWALNGIVVNFFGPLSDCSPVVDLRELIVEVFSVDSFDVSDRFCELADD